MMKKRILYVYHASNIGGGTYCLLNILKEINREIYQPVVMLKSYGPLVDEVEKLNIDVVFFSCMSQVPYNKSLLERNVITRYFDLEKSKKEFEKIVSEIDVDLVYFNTIVLAPYLETCKSLGLKTIIHIREHWPLNEHKFQLSRLQNCIAKNADEIIAINSYSASLVPNRKSTIVYDWIDFSERYEYFPFNKIFNQDTTNLKVFLYTGGHQNIKGFYEVVNAFSNHIKSNDCRLLILGVEGEVKSNGIRGFIKRLLYNIGYDYKRRKALALIQNDSRIVCMNSTYMMKHIFQQSYCNLSYFAIPHANLALAESIVLGTVSIAAKNEESLEYSDNGNLAILYKSNDFNDFLRAIKTLDDNYENIKHRLQNNDVIERMFDRKLNAEKLSKIYSDLLYN